MKKIVLFSVATLLFGLSKAQTFSFYLYFEDAAGNRDTLQIGYAASATDTIDIAFGEFNILSNPLDSVFDVRMSDASINPGRKATYQTKKQILADSCTGWRFPVMQIDIKCQNWPVTASWDSTLFQNACRQGSVFTSMSPGGWWDVFGGASDFNRAFFTQSSSVTFSSNYDSSKAIDGIYAYTNTAGDTLAVFWMAFGDSSLITLSLKETAFSVKIYPNPVKDYLQLDMPDAEIASVQLFDLTGRYTSLDLKEGMLDLRHVPSGSYVLVVRNMHGQVSHQKLLKLED